MTLCIAETSPSKLVHEARAARVLEAWRVGTTSTYEIEKEVGIDEDEVCRIIEENEA